jgi:hypothetical protein
MTVQFFGSQIGSNTNKALSYTSNPFRLLISDIALFFKLIKLVPLIIWPLCPEPPSELDELYPSRANLVCLATHGVLFVLQGIFLVSLPILACIWVFWLFIAYVLMFLAVNQAICNAFLNDIIPAEGLPSTEDVNSAKWDSQSDERWIFLNGVAVG